LEAEVIGEKPAQIQVHYRGWKSTFDEWIERNSDRISPYGRHVKANMHKKMQSRMAKVNDEQHRSRQIQEDSYSRYEITLATKGLEILQVEGDGNCLFRSVSHQVYGDDRYHAIVRAKCMEYMEVSSLHIAPLRLSTACRWRGPLLIYICTSYYYMQVEAHYFENFVVGDRHDFLSYVEKKKKDGIWGDDPEIQAMCEIYSRPGECCEC
jgi:OTU domain-containing protein 5